MRPLPVLLLRAVLLVTAGCGVGALAVLARHRSETPWVGPFSATALALGLLTAAAVCGCILVASASHRRLQACVALVDQWLVQPSHQVPVRPGSAMLFLILALSAYVLLLARFVPLNTVSRRDQAEYLRLAEQIRQDGGWPALGASMLDGSYREANRHPFYPALLAMLPGSDTSDARFARAKGVSVAVGLVGLGVLTWAVARAYSLAVACVVAVLLGTNDAYVRVSSLVACEGMLVLWAGLAWIVATGRAVRAPQPTHLWRWFVLGACTALAYLTKGSAMLLLAGVIAWQMIPTRPSGQRYAIGTALRPVRARAASVLVLLAGFALLAAPLLVRNVRVYHSPLYNSNTPFLFADSFEEGLRRADPSRPLAEIETTRAAAARYWKTHSISGMVRRLTRGAAFELFVLARSLGPSPLGESRALIGALLLLLAAMGMAASAQHADLLLPIWIGLFVFVFGWYVPIASGDRFVLPLIMPIYVYAASAMVRFAQSAGRAAPHRAVRVLQLGAATWCILWVAWSLLSDALPIRLAG